MTLLFLFLSIFAVFYKTYPPKKINNLYGYRTASSMKNIENWNLANKYSANLMLISMLFLLLVSYIAELLDFNAKNWLIGLLILSLGITIFLTEKKIKRNDIPKY
ncbi:SdpI family protein [Flavobacterium sp. TMP13]|uniref:SdpI family protein n=1 Tax=Flavobacterium sp. TMP13 TaxID=3425950 RepID=UPI003D76DBA0